MPVEVPEYYDCSLLEYKEAYLITAAKNFTEYLKENNQKNFKVFGVAQSKMNSEDFIIE